MASTSTMTLASRSNASSTAATTTPGFPMRSISALEAFNRSDTRAPGVPATLTVSIPWCSNSSIPSPAEASAGTIDADVPPTPARCSAMERMSSCSMMGPSAVNETRSAPNAADLLSVLPRHRQYLLHEGALPHQQPGARPRQPRLLVAGDREIRASRPGSLLTEQHGSDPSAVRIIHKGYATGRPDHLKGFDQVSLRHDDLFARDDGDDDERTVGLLQPSLEPAQPLDPSCQNLPHWLRRHRCRKCESVRVVVVMASRVTPALAWRANLN